MTSTSLEQARFVVLEEWANAAGQAGFPVPTRPHLVAIAHAGGVTPMLQRVPEVQSWQATIVWLVQQADAGVEHVLSKLPPQLVKPGGDGEAPAPRGDAAPQSREQVRLHSLLAWQASSGDPRAAQLRETHLRLVANSHVGSADEIRSIFPPVVSQFADDLAAALGGPRRGPTVSSAAPVPAVPPQAAAQFPVSGPAPEHAVESVPPVEAPPAPDLTVDPDGFAPYEFGASDTDPATIRIRRRPEGGIALSWPAAATAMVDEVGSDDAASDAGAHGEATGVVVIDRLITADQFAPYSPDAARLVTATRGTEAVDELEFAHAARHYQVWRNTGTSLTDAKLAQPVKVASGELVSPVLDLDLREDEGRVIGQWRVLPGTTRVQVFRIPVQLAAGASGDPAYRILADETNLGGFVDTEADRGQRYLYQVFAEAEFDGVARLSAPSNSEVLVSAVHEPVRDLRFELLDDDRAPLFDLTWTVPPGGQVVVYRTEQPHQPGIERQATAAAALPQAGLPEPKRLAHPITQEGGQATMHHVPWPHGWTRAYFTTVVLLGDRAYVGNTVRGVRVPKVSRPKIVERVNRQVLTFEWPEGADTVLAYASMPGIESKVAMQGQPIEISRGDYRERGGLEFAAGRLDAKGCDLHLVSVAFDGGNRVLAAPEVVSYPGLLRIWYRITVQALPNGRPLLRVQLRSETDVEHAPPFVLVHHPERLPLTIGDGRPVAVVPDGPPGRAPQRRFVPSPLLSKGQGLSTWVVEPEHFFKEVPPAGFLRLFVDLPPEVLRRVALLDPPVSTLRLPPPMPQATSVATGGGAGGGQAH